MLPDAWHSWYIWMYPADSISAETASNALLNCCTAFRFPTKLISNGPAHFKNETLRLLPKFLPHSLPLQAPLLSMYQRIRGRIFKSALTRRTSTFVRAPFDTILTAAALTTFPTRLSRMHRRTSWNPYLRLPPVLFSYLPHLYPHWCAVAAAYLKTIKKTRRENCLIIDTLVSRWMRSTPLVQQFLTHERQPMRMARYKGEFPNLEKEDFVLVVQEHFHEDDNMFLRQCGPRQKNQVFEWLYPSSRRCTRRPRHVAEILLRWLLRWDMHCMPLLLLRNR